MDENIREQRRKQAILARHHIYAKKEQPQSYVSSLSPDEREKFMEGARAANKKLLRKRKRRSRKPPAICATGRMPVMRTIS